MNEIATYALTIMAMVMGITAHVVKKVVQTRNTDKTFSLKKYLVAYPYRTVMTVFAGVIGYAMLAGEGDLGFVSAFLAGFSANSLGGAADQ